MESGGHQASALAVAEGRADFAALDALTWIMLQRYDSFAADLVEVDRTDPTPALPYITAMGRDAKPLKPTITLFTLIETSRSKRAASLPT